MPKRGSHHQRIAGLNPKRTQFDLSYEKKFTADFGRLIPVMCDEVVPGDHFKINCQTVLRTQPMFAPLLHEISVTTHYFFVPYRLLWEHWENFITGGPNGEFNMPLPRYDTRDSIVNNASPDAVYRKYSIWDYLGFPISRQDGGHFEQTSSNPGENYPIAFPKRAYNLIWEEYYRDENTQAKLGYDSWDSTPDPIPPTTRLDGRPNSMQDAEATQPNLVDAVDAPYLRNWTKDYFTSALPFQQRGQQPGFPIDINGGIVSFDGTINSVGVAPSLTQTLIMQGTTTPASQATFAMSGATTDNPALAFKSFLNNNHISIGTDQVASFNVNDLRRIVQLQKWKERNARGGIRYTEVLRAHFGTSPRDDRLNRPEYIGGTRSNVVVSEVLQTSSNAGNDPGTSPDTPQGNMSGHGLMASNGHVGSYYAQEYGLIMGIMSIMPTPTYEDGIDRQWLRTLNTDFYWPEFVNLSEQGIYTEEIYASGNPVYDTRLWGYQPQYDEMRIKRNMALTDFRVNTTENLAFWHLGRAFSGIPPLSSNFYRVNPNQFNRCFAVDNFPHFIVSHANIIRATRPIPYIGEPGLVDHH